MCIVKKRLIYVLENSMHKGYNTKTKIYIVSSSFGFKTMHVCCWNYKDLNTKSVM